MPSAAAASDRLRTAPEEIERAPRGSLRLLLDPTFGPFFLGKVLSTAGVWVHNIAAALVVWDLTASATLVGAVSIAQFAPQLLLTPLCGAMADRGDRQRQVIVGRLITAAGSGALAVGIAAVGLAGVPGALAVIGAALVVGIGFSVGGPAMQALIPALVRRNELPAAVALSSAPATLARAAGPALGALLVSGAGPAVAFGVAAGGSLLFALVVAVIRVQEQARAATADASVRAGLRHIGRDRAVVALLLGTAAIGIGADPVITLTPPIAAGLGGGSSLVGALASTFGVGAALTFLLLGVLRRHVGLPRMGVGGLLLMALGMALLALAPTPAAALLAMGIGGCGFTLSVTALATLIQERTSEDLRGRVMAVWMIAFLGSRPLAAGVNGAVADALSPAAALGVVVGILLLGSALVRPRRVQVPAVAPAAPSLAAARR